MITGSVVLDFTACDNDQARRRCRHLGAVPDGAVVRLLVGRQHPSAAVVSLVHAHVNRLSIEVVGTDPIRVREWVDAVRSGDPWSPYEVIR